MATNSKQLARRFFSQSAAAYSDGSAVQQYVAASLAAFAFMGHPPAARRILDLGCSSQVFAGQYITDEQEQQLIGMDFAESMLHEAAARYGEMFAYVCADAESLPFAAQSFDLIYSSSVLHWCSDTDVALRECRRVLCDNGLLLVATYGPATLRELRCSWKAVDKYSHTLHFSPLATWKSELCKAGFQVSFDYSQIKIVLHDNVYQLMTGLKNLGVRNCRYDRPQGLVTPKQLQAMQERYYALYAMGKKIPASYEILFFVAKAI